MFPEAVTEKLRVEAKAMLEETFGPVLPVIPFDSLQDLLNRLEELPAPLVAYSFIGGD